MNTNITIRLSSNVSFDLIYVEGGIFAMGDYGNPRPIVEAHPVKLSDFYIGKFPVIQQLWEAVMGENPAAHKGKRYPVENISWNDTQLFLNKLNQREEVKSFFRQFDLSSAKFRLPTEAEWEYAARGGKYSQGYTYAGSDKLKQVGWYRDNSSAETKEVGLLLANELGIHDMSGNVFEWCSDWFGEEYYKKCLEDDIVVDPPGPPKGTSRVLRGGGYFFDPLFCRSVDRGRHSPGNRYVDIGFRLVLSFQSAG